ncbi:MULTISPECIES: ANTAR domain-containing protein [Streptomyces]|uniref:ANTAR domain-containing protein n=1 Tax=Streptomyces doudnae TaxID=3075536 RepID=A0ABD5EWR3_9ACTN|nr:MULTISPECIES: ANTAR domain-containing protein [unclassified Streptomyces]MDT0438765.1 ANTAR domain-containing protein [Streptomyces sp. DSM 41981]MYQ68809.1 ANTAR domain-containing protein [Streptomyces sp. SID4950]SCE49190.1 ANTAR domain-containing protein [Streptomyces sp. SolWspMP-5a-2]
MDFAATPDTPPPDPAPAADREVRRLETEVAQLHEAVASHAVVDQAIGVVVALAKTTPADGFQVLREISQHTNVKLRAVAGHLIAWTQGRPLPPDVAQALDAVLRRVTPHPPEADPPGDTE